MAEFTVAIELGSSKITGIAGRKNKDGSINVLAIAQEDAAACIRKGVVYNIDKTVQALSNVIKKLETSLKSRVARVYIGVGGQSIQSVRNNINKELPSEREVTPEMIDELMDTNRSMQYPEKQILDAITQEYRVDNYFTTDPVGVQCQRIEGNFLNILLRKSFYRSLLKCFDQANITILDKYLSPLAMADSVLTETEKRGGCVLVDLGAETTTVCVFYKSILRHLAVIPLGGNNISKDIATLQMDDKDAEQMKLKYGSAYTDSKDIDKSRKYPIDEDRTVDMPKFVDIVEARTREIIENVWHVVPDEYSAEKLIGGIVLTGGGSNMPNIERAFSTYTRISKIRVAKFVNTTIKSNNATVNVKDGRLCAVLGILDKCDENCSGGDIEQTLQFGEKETAAPASNGTRQTGTGRIMDDPAEIQRQKEEEAEKKRKEDAERLRKEEEEAERIREEKRKNSWIGKIKSGLSRFGQTVFKDEEGQ